jgi:hypothetical protein
VRHGGVQAAHAASPGSEAFTSRSDSRTLGGRKHALLLLLRTVRIDTCLSDVDMVNEFFVENERRYPETPRMALGRRS